MDVYNIFFNICLGLFISGLIMSIISIFLAGTTIQHLSMGHIDHIDHVDHIDHIDHVDHADQINHIDHIDHIDHADHINHVGHMEHINQVDHTNQSEHAGHFNKDHLHKVAHFKDSGDSTGQKDITPAPFMLLFSEFLLVFGISGVLYYFFISEELKWTIFFITPLTGYLFTKLVSILWKRIAINRHYDIISNRNVIGKVGEVVLDVDNKGGVIKIKSETPLEFEKIQSKPLYPEKQFFKGEYVYIYGKKDGYFLIDDKTPPGVEEIKLCPNCGAPMEKAEDGSFCVYCGAKLSH